MKEIDIEYLRECLTYCQRTGALSWNARPRHHFKSEAAMRSFNTRYAGRSFGCVHISRSPSYIVGSIAGGTRRAHRIAWAMHWGEWPKGEVDHINHDGTDNRMANLRCVTHAENARNVPPSKANRSGCTGVHWDQARSQWMAYITVGGRRRHLGRFTHKAMAEAARKSAEAEAGFHPNHGVDASRSK